MISFCPYIQAVNADISGLMDFETDIRM